VDLWLGERGPSSLQSGMIRLDMEGELNRGGLALYSDIGSGLSVLGRNSSVSASSSDASSRYAARLGMRRFGFGEMISSGDTTVAGGDSGALKFKGRREGASAMRGPWASSVDSIDSTSDGWTSSQESLDACY
jgi:hypothetical protein